MRALLLAVKAQLQTSLATALGITVGDTVVDIRDGEGEPPPVAGELFFAVCEGEWTGGPDQTNVEEAFGVEIVISRRSSYAPGDRTGTEILTKAAATGSSARHSGLLALAEAVRAIVLNRGDAIITAANVTIGGSANGFCEPMRFRHAGKSRQRGPDWWGADHDSDVCGLSLTLTFGGAKRHQSIESVT